MEILDGYGLKQRIKAFLQGLVHTEVVEIQFLSEIALSLCVKEGT